MPHLSWNEVRDRAIRFSREHAGDRSESAQKQTFWNDFSHVFGLPRPSFASLEVNVTNLKGNNGAIDHLRPQVPLPPGLTISHIQAAVNATQSLVARINANLTSSGGKPLVEYIQGNNFSGIVFATRCMSIPRIGTTPIKRIPTSSTQRPRTQGLK